METRFTLRRPLRRAYQLMRARFGHQHWWPGETPFEICVGAILTQNTNWDNVERAIASLKAAGVLEPGRLLALSESKLAQLIRPAGYFNVKARRLREFLRVLVEEFNGELNRLFTGETSVVRERLLAIHGIGPETADSMLLYAGGHRSFVIDAYTKRIFQRHQWAGESLESEVPSLESAARSGRPGSVRSSKFKARDSKFTVQGSTFDGFSYDALKALCESVLKERPPAELLDHWQDYHAQLVMVGKHFCRPRQPRCDQCPLRPLLPREV